MIPKINHKYLIKCCGGESIGECIDYNYDDNDKKFYFFLIDGEEWWASQAIDDTDSAIRSLLELTNSCIELKINVEDAKQLQAQLSLHNATNYIELETNKWIIFCISLRQTEISEIAKKVENKLNAYASQHLNNRD